MAEVAGGPLFSQDGTVITVNTAIDSPSGGNVEIAGRAVASIRFGKNKICGDEIRCHDFSQAPLDYWAALSNCGSFGPISWERCCIR